MDEQPESAENSNLIPSEQSGRGEGVMDDEEEPPVVENDTEMRNVGVDDQAVDEQSNRVLNVDVDAAANNFNGTNEGNIENNDERSQNDSYLVVVSDDVPVDLSEDEQNIDEDLIFDDESPPHAQRAYITEPRLLHLLMAQNRATEAGAPDLLNDNTFVQRLRRLMFSMDRYRERGNNGRHGAIGDRGGRRNSSNAINENGDSADGGDVGANSNNTNNEQENAQPVVEDEEPENPISFDTNLPAEHSYLGVNMDRVSGVNYLEVGNHRLMLFMHNYILLPGEVLPFMATESLFSNEIDAQNGFLFGICFAHFGQEHGDNIYGVTCQIYEKGSDRRDTTLIKSRALQRFVTTPNLISGPLQYINNHPSYKCYGTVGILPEISMPDPLSCIDMGSLARFRDNSSMKDMYMRYQAATSPWPVHVFQNYSLSIIREKARTQLSQHKIDTMPSDPGQLSYWLLRNLHLSESVVREIFVVDSVNLRLKMISSTFKEKAIFTCRFCDNRIADCSELFAMSKHGVQNQYCNSAGYVHETNTVYRLLPEAIQYSGGPSTEFSWFPGYQWTVIICKYCTRHVGWEFKALEPNLVPKKFFGLSSSSVRVTSNINPHRESRADFYRDLLNLTRRELI